MSRDTDRKRGDTRREDQVKDPYAYHQITGKKRKPFLPFNTAEYGPDPPTMVQRALGTGEPQITPEPPEPSEPTEDQINRDIAEANHARAEAARMRMEDLAAQAAESERMTRELLEQARAERAEAQVQAIPSSILGGHTGLSADPTAQQLQNAREEAQQASARVAELAVEIRVLDTAHREAAEQAARTAELAEAAQDDTVRARLRGVLDDDAIEEAVKAARRKRDAGTVSTPDMGTSFTERREVAPSAPPPVLSPQLPPAPPPVLPVALPPRPPLDLDATQVFSVEDDQDKDEEDAVEQTVILRRPVTSRPQDRLPLAAKSEPRGHSMVPPPQPDRSVTRADVKDAKLDLDSGELALDQAEVDTDPSRKTRDIVPADLHKDLQLSPPRPSAVSAPVESRSGGLDLALTVVKKAWEWFWRIPWQARLIVAGVVIAATVAIIGSLGGSQIDCSVPGWGPPTSRWQQDCSAATSDKRTIAKVGDSQYDLMAEKLPGLKPTSIPYVWMLLSSGGSDAYTNHADLTRGLIPQTPDKLQVAAQHLGITTEDLTKVKATVAPFAAPDHLSSWRMAIWSINKAWGELSLQPQLRNRYANGCKQQRVAVVPLGHHVTLCQLLMHVLPNPWVQPQGDKSYVRWFVAIAKGWSNGIEPQEWRDLAPGLADDPLGTANERACQPGSPGIIKGRACKNSPRAKK